MSDRAKDEIPLPTTGGGSEFEKPPLPTPPQPGAVERPPMPTDAGLPAGEI